MVNITTPQQLLVIGLEIVGCNDHTRQKNCEESNRRRFRAHFGSNPEVYLALWDALRTTGIAAASIDPSKSSDSLFKFMVALHFLKVYPTEECGSTQFNMSIRTYRGAVWTFLLRFQALKQDKVRAC